MTIKTIPRLRERSELTLEADMARVIGAYRKVNFRYAGKSGDKMDQEEKEAACKILDEAIVMMDKIRRLYRPEEITEAFETIERQTPFGRLEDSLEVGVEDIDISNLRRMQSQFLTERRLKERRDSIPVRFRYILEKSDSEKY